VFIDIAVLSDLAAGEAGTWAGKGGLGSAGAEDEFIRRKGNARAAVGGEAGTRGTCGLVQGTGGIQAFVLQDADIRVQGRRAEGDGDSVRSPFDVLGVVEGLRLCGASRRPYGQCVDIAQGVGDGG